LGFLAGSFDKNPKTNNETKKVTVVYTKIFKLNIFERQFSYRLLSKINYLAATIKIKLERSLSYCVWGKDTKVARSKAIVVFLLKQKQQQA
jgi:hypothetical protein